MQKKGIFIVGFQRSGTTFIYNLLKKNNDVLEYKVNSDLKENYLLNRNKPNIDQFNEIFKSEKFIDIEPSYSNSEVAASNILEVFGKKTKIVFIVKNPEDYFKSLYNHYLKINNNRLSKKSEDLLFEYLDIKKAVNIYKYRFPNRVYTFSFNQLFKEKNENEWKSLLNILGCDSLNFEDIDFNNFANQNKSYRYFNYKFLLKSASYFRKLGLYKALNIIKLIFNYFFQKVEGKKNIEKRILDRYDLTLKKKNNIYFNSISKIDSI